MKISFWLYLFQGSILLNLLTSHTVTAQIIPDQSLPENSIVTPQGDTLQIDGGTRAGNNLFHSFQEFSVRTGNNAHFNNAVEIQNIFSRVTGSSISNIDGLIRSNGTANLFLVNPNGIVFGANASLDIGGSFVASTANRVIFSDGFEFSTVNPQANQLLTVNVPMGLGFSSTPGQIINQSRHEVGSELIGRTENAGGFSVDSNIAGLQVKEGKSIALVGGDVVFDGGNLTAIGGRIEVGSVVGDSIVSLTETATGWQLGYEGVQAFQDISLFPRTIIDSSGEAGGAIQLQGKRIILTGDQNFSPVFIYSNTVGEGTGGTVEIKATEAIEINGSFSVIATFPQTTGTAGDILIETPNLFLKDASLIQSSGSLENVGKAGNLTILVSEQIKMFGTTDFPIISASALTGDGGNLSIQTKNLTLENGAQIATTTFGTGKAGSLRLDAANIKIIGEIVLQFEDENGEPQQLAFASGLYTQTEGSGSAGDLTINTERLSVLDGGLISAGTFNKGQGGTLNINASESISLDGIGLVSRIGGLSATSSAKSSGDGGSINVTTRQLTVENGAFISARSLGTGKAGKITINADRLLVQNQGIIRTESNSTQGGDINITLNDRLVLLNQSNISATAGLAEDAGDGGNITIDSPLILAVPTENSNITANAFRGKGGNVTITTEGIFGIQFRKEPTPLSDITASSEFGIQGNVIIANPNANLVNSLVEFPENPVDVPSLVAQNVCRTDKIRGSTFSVTGRGGLPPNPGDPVTQDATVDWATRSSQEKKPPVILKPRSQNHQPVIQQVQGWKQEANGTIVLTADAATVNPQTPAFNSPSCR